MDTSWERILDANLNRAREGLRVAEELARLLLESGPLQRRLKRLRHAVAETEPALGDLRLLRARAASQDPGAHWALPSEARKTSWVELARANMRRAQEALRVLEECSKILPANPSLRFKRLRFQAYDLESDLVEQLARHDGSSRKKPRRHKG